MNLNMRNTHFMQYFNGNQQSLKENLSSYFAKNREWLTPLDTRFPDGFPMAQYPLVSIRIILDHQGQGQKPSLHIFINASDALMPKLWVTSHWLGTFSEALGQHYERICISFGFTRIWRLVLDQHSKNLSWIYRMGFNPSKIWFKSRMKIIC